MIFYTMYLLFREACHCDPSRVTALNFCITHFCETRFKIIFHLLLLPETVQINGVSTNSLILNLTAMVDTVVL